MEIDPSSFIAQQELRRTLQMIKEAQNPGPQAPGNRRDPDCASGWNRRRARSNWLPSQAPITLKLTEKSNVIYETVGKLAGINVLFDPDYTPARCASS